MLRVRPLLLVLVGTAALAACATPTPQHDQQRDVQPAPPVTYTRAPSTPPVRDVAAPKPLIPHDYVAPAGPTRFVLTGAKFTIKAKVCAMAPVFPLDPPGEQRHTVCWVTKGFGHKPGSETATTYVLGHSWAGDRLEVLNKMSWAATAQVLHAKPVKRDGVTTYPVTALTGYKLVLSTPTGVLTYVVHDAYGVRKLKLAKVSSTLDANVRNRIVLITCATLNGVDYDYNIVVSAYLHSSVKAAPAAR